MTSLRASFQNELQKIMLRRKTFFFLLLTALLPIASALVLDGMQGGLGLSPVVAGDLPLRTLSLFTILLIPLVVFMTAADLFAGETGEGTMKLPLTRPVTRFRLYLSKQAALVFTIGVYLAAGLAFSLASALLLEERSGWLAGLGEAVPAYAAAVVPMFVISTMAVLLAQSFRQSTGALAIMIVLYVLAKLAAVLVPDWNIYNPVAYTGWHTLWIGGVPDGSKIFGIFSLLAACAILCFTAGYALFDKKEF